MNNLPGITKRLAQADGQTHIVTRQVLDPHFFDAIRAVKDSENRKSLWRYRGSVPRTIAQQWARECGSAIGTREWKVYAMRKLDSGEFNRLIGK